MNIIVTLALFLSALLPAGAIYSVHNAYVKSMAVHATVTVYAGNDWLFNLNHSEVENDDQ